MRVSKASGRWYIATLGLATASSICLLTAESFQAGMLVHGYLLWNIILAWLPFGLALWLVRVLRGKLWSSWAALFLTVAWVVFLPNSFYMVSDFIHLAEVDPTYVLFSAVTFTSFILTGMFLGISAVYVVHIEMLKRVSPRLAAGIVGGLLLLSSGAIYIGRDLRWNSWDVLLNPFGLLFDVSDRLLHPSQYGTALAVILPFFILLGSVYVVSWRAARFAAGSPRLTK